MSISPGVGGDWSRECSNPEMSSSEEEELLSESEECTSNQEDSTEAVGEAQKRANVVEENTGVVDLMFYSNFKFHEHRGKCMSNHQGSQQTSEQFYMEAVKLLQFAFHICWGL